MCVCLCFLLYFSSLSLSHTSFFFTVIPIYTRVPYISYVLCCQMHELNTLFNVYMLNNIIVSSFNERCLEFLFQYTVCACVLVCLCAVARFSRFKIFALWIIIKQRIIHSIWESVLFSCVLCKFFSQFFFSLLLILRIFHHHQHHHLIFEGLRQMNVYIWIEYIFSIG